MGCFEKLSPVSPLQGPAIRTIANMTIQICIEWCREKGSTFAGVAVSNNITVLLVYVFYNLETQ